MAAGAAEAAGAITPPRPLVGIANPAPEYPYASRIRMEQGRVTLRVQVDPRGAVAAVAVERSSGFAALDRAAEQAVRGWRFEPAMRGGAPVVANATVGITFRLDGDRRW
jgi:protein TonB